MSRDLAPRPPSSSTFFSLALLIGLGALGCGTTETALGKSQANPLDAEENSLLFELNRFREAAGLDIVAACTSLNQSASEHSDDMRDQGYLGDMGKDGSTPHTRACAAGYQEACGGSVTMAEVVASGSASGKSIFPSWTMDEKTKALLQTATVVVVGVGRSLGDKATWTLDLAAKDEPSCD
jgi:uncharacterized protein YkwD